MNQEKELSQFEDASDCELLQKMDEASIDVEGKLTLCAQSNQDLEFSDKETSIQSKSVVENDSISEAMESSNVSVSSVEACFGDTTKMEELASNAEFLDVTCEDELAVPDQELVCSNSYDVKDVNSEANKMSSNVVLQNCMDTVKSMEYFGEISGPDKECTENKVGKELENNLSGDNDCESEDKRVDENMMARKNEQEKSTIDTSVKAPEIKHELDCELKTIGAAMNLVSSVNCNDEVKLENNSGNYLDTDLEIINANEQSDNSTSKTNSGSNHIVNHIDNEKLTEKIMQKSDILQNAMCDERETQLGDRKCQEELKLNIFKIDNISIPGDKEESPIEKVFPQSLACGDNAITNQINDDITNGIEVMSSVENDGAKLKPAVHEKELEEGSNGSQRPRSRAYPFKVLVSGLPLSARREDVMYYFSQFGEVLKLWDEGRHRANVLFANEESFKKAVFAPDPYFDDHKLLIRSLNETIAVISGIPRSMSVKNAEKNIKSILEEAGAQACRIVVPMSDPAETSENNILQGHALIAFSDLQTFQKAEARHVCEPFMIAGNTLELFASCNEFYEKYCVRVHPLPAEQQRAVVYHNIHSTFASIGEIVSIICVYVGNATAYAGYVLFDSEESVKQATEMEDPKILGQFVQVQAFHPFEQGQGFRHLWLKILNLPPRVTITEVKHHFGHDRGILEVELDLDFGSCFMHVNSEPAMQRCLRMHQTYLRGKCLAVLIAEDHPERSHYRDHISRRGRNRQNFRNNSNRKKAAANNSTSNFGGKTFTSATQPQGGQDRRGYERGDRKFPKSRFNNSKEVPKTVKENGDGVDRVTLPPAE